MFRKTIKLLIALPFLVALLIGIGAGVIYAFDQYKIAQNRDRVIQASLENDPSQLKLMNGSNDYIRRVSLKGGIECGIVTMKNGEEVKYWFRSHHLSGDQGHARFEFPGGRVRMMTGYFCCEVMFPQDEFESVKELDAFLAEVDGKSP